jgi:cytoskeletal protein CcmA (bactofilin family)
MFGKKKDTDQDQSIPKSKEEPKLTDDSKSGFEKAKESGKEAEMANVTQDSEIKGTIKFGQAMRVDGNFEGELSSDNGELIVGKTGKVKATVKVKSAVVEGRVDGNIRASDKVELKQSARIFGDVQAKTLIVEQGVIFVGNCNVNPEGAKIEGQSYKAGIREEIKEEIKGGIKEDIKVNRLVNV